MSLNWKEIDAILAELPLRGARIQRIVQPSFDSLVLGLYAGGQEFDVLLSIAHGACRIHRLSARISKPERPLRFMECLRSRIRGGRIDEVVQLGRERIIRFYLSVPRRGEGEGDEAPPVEIRHYRLYARLWSGAGNILLCEEDGTIIDVMARRPKRGEISGEMAMIEEDLDSGAGPTKEFAIRNLPPLPGRDGGGDFNERIEAWYAQQGGELSREKLLEVARDRYRKRERILSARIGELERRAAEYRDAGRQRELGDILMANQAAEYLGRFLHADDFYRGGEVSIPVDPGKSIVENAQAYYERAKKANSGLAELEAEIQATKASLELAGRDLARLEATDDPLLIARALEKGGTVRTSQRRSYPGLSLERSGWTILVGRSAKENDELLRRHVRGSDLWLHARDYPGSYVFVKARAGKTVPLEVLLDAGTLALYYSKGRSSGEGELYYTHAKYLRRAKNGPKGLVIPTQEKNLHVRIEEARLRELRALIGQDGE